jgi:glycine dehydrogenase
VRRHIGSGKDSDLQAMLSVLGLDSLDALAKQAVPKNIQIANPLQIGHERGENEVLQELAALARKNQVYTSFLGMGYYGTITPPGRPHYQSYRRMKFANPDSVLNLLCSLK